MSVTRVVHVNDQVEGAVYIGRANGRKRLKASPFANPFTVKEHGRQVAIALYRGWLFNGVSGVQVLARLPELRGKPLACWCRHDGEAKTAKNECHGDVLIDLLERFTDAELQSDAASEHHDVDSGQSML